MTSTGVSHWRGGALKRYHHAMTMADPPRPIDSLARAVQLLTAGAWQEAHEIVQREDSTFASWLHGIVHTLEGDLGNARYWYRKASRVFPGPGAVQQEIAAARQIVAGSEPGRAASPWPESR